MTREKAIEMMRAKVECLKCYGSSWCINCRFNYEQGNNGQQIIWIKMAIKALQEPERKHGRWTGVFGNRATCSNCKEEQDVECFVGNPTQKYCARCGARMDAEEEKA